MRALIEASEGNQIVLIGKTIQESDRSMAIAETATAYIDCATLHTKERVLTFEGAGSVRFADMAYYRNYLQQMRGNNAKTLFD